MESNKPGEMTTVSSVLETLRLKKLDNEFKATPQGFTTTNGKYYQPEELKITKVYRFEGESDPSDSSAIYLLEANDGMTGYIMDAYGIYSDHDDTDFDEMIKKIPLEGRDEQQTPD